MRLNLLTNVHLKAKIVARTVSGEVKYNLELPNGLILKDIPANCIQESFNAMAQPELQRHDGVQVLDIHTGETHLRGSQPSTVAPR